MKMIQNKPIVLGAALIALMAATRMHHFGSTMHLPYASLAVFLLTGLLVASPLFFGFLLLEAAALDYVAITHMGVSDYCVTSSYWFLIPTYAVLWIAGRAYAQIHQDTVRSLGLFSAISFAAVSVAFFISNGAFYLFSGRYPNMNMSEYASRVAQYYLPYVTSAVIYLVPAVLLYVVFKLGTEQTKHAG